GSPSTCAIRKVEARGRKLGARGGRRMCPYGHGLRHVRPPMSAEAWTRGPGAGQVAGRRGVCLAIALRPGTAAMSSIVPPPARRAMRARNAWGPGARVGSSVRSEEHTSELQSRENLVCRLLLEKKNRKIQ